MTEFRRLLDDAPSAELRAVLESASRDQPSPRALTRAAQTLGIGATGLGLARAAAAAAGSRAVHASRWIALAKWGGAGILLGGLALSPVVLNTRGGSSAKVSPAGAPQALLHHSDGHEATPTQAAATASAEPAVSIAPALSTAPAAALAPAAAAGSIATRALAATARSSPALESAPARVPMNTSRAAPSAEARFPQPDVPSTPSASSAPSAPRSAARPDPLDSEITLLDSTRTAIKSGDPQAALALLDRQAQLSVRSLGAEATLLRVQALLLAGRSNEARAVARAALNGEKNRPYAARLRKLAGLTE